MELKEYLEEIAGILGKLYRDYPEADVSFTFQEPPEPNGDVVKIFLTVSRSKWFKKQARWAVMEDGLWNWEDPDKRAPQII